MPIFLRIRIFYSEHAKTQCVYARYRNIQLLLGMRIYSGRCTKDAMAQRSILHSLLLTLTISCTTRMSIPMEQEACKCVITPRFTGSFYSDRLQCDALKWTNQFPVGTTSTHLSGPVRIYIIKSGSDEYLWLQSGSKPTSTGYCKEVLDSLALPRGYSEQGKSLLGGDLSRCYKNGVLDRTIFAII
jgi:hypothetical protein